jgi:phosphinothricin acetyltransferase
MKASVASNESFHARLALPADAPAIASIYNQAIAERNATLEATLLSADDVLHWLDRVHPVVVVTDERAGADDGTPNIVAFARSSGYRPHECYRGIFDVEVYGDHRRRRQGAGSLAMRTLLTLARSAGAWKLVSRMLVENTACRALLEALGFREVGVYYRHGKLDGRWRDVVVAEKFLAPIGAETAAAPSRAQTRDDTLAALTSRDASTMAEALDQARFVVERDGFVDLEILEAALDTFFGSRIQDATSRARFVALFRVCAATASDAARDLVRSLFERLAQVPLTELDAFYETAFVIKQVALGGGAETAVATANRAVLLAPHLPRLLDLLRQSIELPPSMRTRISAANVSALLMTLALAGAESVEDKQRIAHLAAVAKSRHRVEPPASIRTLTSPPPAPAPLQASTHGSVENTERTQKSAKRATSASKRKRSKGEKRPKKA